MRGSDSPLVKKFYITRKRRLIRFVLYEVVILMKKKSLASAFHPDLIGNKGKRYFNRRITKLSTP